MLLAGIAELLSVFVEPLKRPDRLGHPAARVILAIIFSICLVVLMLNLSGWWLLCCMLPLLYLPYRWIRMRRRQKRAFSTRIKDRQPAIHDFINQLSSQHLFEWEIRRFLLPLLIELHSHGSIIRLKKILEELQDYADNFYFNQAQQGIMEVEHRHHEMLGMLRISVMETANRNSRYYPLYVNNLYHTAMTIGDSVATDYAFQHIETYVASQSDESKIPLEMLEAMMYRYDIGNDSSGVQRVRGIISRRHPRTFDEYLCLNDIIMFYNRRHGNRMEILAYLDESEEKAKTMITDEEQRLRFNLRMITFYIEFNYGWREKTVEMFTDAEKYLSYSPSIAFEYMRMVLNTVKDAQLLHNLSLPPDRLEHLLLQIQNLVGQYIDRHRHELFECDDELLYKKRDAYRFIVDYARLKASVKPCIDEYVKTLLESYQGIIDLCRKNGELSELAHSLMTILDESLTAESAVRYALSQGDTSVDLKHALKIIENNRRTILEYHGELKRLLSHFNYDRLSAYPTLWAANFCAALGEIGEAKFLFGKFEEHGISVLNYRLPVQQMYHHLRLFLYPDSLNNE